MHSSVLSQTAPFSSIDQNWPRICKSSLSHCPRQVRFESFTFCVGSFRVSQRFCSLALEQRDLRFDFGSKYMRVRLKFPKLPHKAKKAVIDLSWAKKHQSTL